MKSAKQYKHKMRNSTKRQKKNQKEILELKNAMNEEELQ